MIPADYIPVIERLTAMRVDHPDWALTTVPVVDDGTRVLFRAEIRDAAGTTVSTAYAEEFRADRRFILETCETSAVGRALRHAGYPDKRGLTEEEHLRDTHVTAGRDTDITSGRNDATAATIPGMGDGITGAQLKLVGMLMSELGMRDRDAAIAHVTDIIGRPVQSRAELTRAEASKVIDSLTALRSIAQTPDTTKVAR